MKAIAAIAYIFIVYSIGDYISIKTKSIVSSLFTCSLIFLIGFWIGVPNTLFEDSGLLQIGSIIIPAMMVHMGSMININQLKEQWKTFLLAVGAVFGIAILLLLIGPFIIGREASIVSAPPIAGGLIAGIQIGEFAKTIDRDDLSLLATFLVVVQGFVGYPLASFFLKKEAIRLKSSNDLLIKEEHKKDEIREIDKKDVLENFLLAKTFLIALIATAFSQFCVERLGLKLVDKNIVALILGIIFCESGVIESNILRRANSFGFLIASIMVVIFSNLATATPDIVINLLPIIIGALFIGTIGILLTSFVLSKILKLSIYMSFAIGVSALFGFPGTFILSNEVSKAVGKNQKERELILNKILPKMLVAGFATVSIASVVLAGILGPML